MPVQIEINKWSEVWNIKIKSDNRSAIFTVADLPTNWIYLYVKALVDTWQHVPRNISENANHVTDQTKSESFNIITQNCRECVTKTLTIIFKTVCLAKECEMYDFKLFAKT